MVRMLKILLIATLSITLIACEEGTEGASNQKWVYGEHYDYTGLPEGYTVTPDGQIQGFEVPAADITTVCGFHYFQNTDGDIFWADYSGETYITKALGYATGLPSIGESKPETFTSYPYEAQQLTSVGRYVVMSLLPAYISGPYGLWTRTNHSEPIHDDCLMILDGPNQTLKQYNHLTDVLTVIF